MSFKLSLGKTAITTKPTYTNEAIMAFLDKGRCQFDLGYMWHQFRSKDWTAGTNTAVMGKTLNKQTLGAATIKLPSLSDQLTIAKRLDKVREQLHIAEQEQDTLDQLVKSRFVELFGDPNEGEYRYSPKPIESICTAFVGGGTPSMKHPEYYGGTIPFIKSGDVKAKVITEGALTLTEEGLVNSSAKLIPKDSIVIVTRSGILKHTLPIAIAGCPVAINQDLKAITLQEGFLAQYVQWALLVSAPLILSKVRATTADNIETKLLKQFAIPVPPLELQQEFADFVAQVDKSRFVASAHHSFTRGI